MEEEEKIFRLGLSRVNGVGPVTFRQLADRLDRLRGLEKLSGRELRVLIGQKLSTVVRSKCDEIDTKAIREQILKEKVRFKVYGEKNYPFLLGEIYDPPPVFYYEGDFAGVDFNKCISVVGTRAASNLGKEITELFVKDLVKEGFTIVSGMAFGIDSAAHKCALKENGKTIAVLGGPVDCPSPMSNWKIYDDIINNGGLIISEIPKGGKIESFNFPLRNRIISGLSLGTIVIEAGEKSGALITASSAIDQNREVFAVPWSLNEQGGKGANNLIKEGKAKLVESVEDILVEFGYRISEEKFDNINRIVESNLEISEVEKKVLSVVGSKPSNTEEISKLTEINIGTLTSILLELEVKGLVMKEDNGRWRQILISF